MADRALLRTQVFAQPLAHGVGFGLFHAAAQVVEHAFERLAPAVLFTVHPVFKFERFAAAAVQDGAAHLLRQLFERHGQHVRLLQPLGQLAQQQIVVDDQMARTAPPARNRPVFDRQRRVGHDLRGVHDLLDAEPVAVRTRPVRRIE